ncbi:MAG: imidazoleglycerol-phosphate dehydratase [Candidatus Bathyarchaeota archaeon]|nr:imidazoleglycerol-phosphate dehydratase [Candidatus Bathyarchaeota archaeon]MCZ2844887.1 imidazoleglycerol-phosphate dehydratase [Candidatus Bathyarchaeota archaeon]
MRISEVKRETLEVSIKVKLNIDGNGFYKIETGNKFLNHVLSTIAKHSLFDLEITATGDLKHHVAEDVALTLGEALLKALGDKQRIKRFGSNYVVMDDSLARAVVDLGGRPHSQINIPLKGSEVEDLCIEDIFHFFESMAQASKSNIHLDVLYGTNDHHKVEAVSKALALTLREACSIDPRINSIPSAKGVI